MRWLNNLYKRCILSALVVLLLVGGGVTCIFGEEKRCGFPQNVELSETGLSFG